MSFIRVTREHREMLVKLAKQNTNKAKDSLRRVRTNAMNKVKKCKDKVSEDTIRLVEKQVLVPAGAMLFMCRAWRIMYSCLRWEASDAFVHVVKVDRVFLLALAQG